MLETLGYTVDDALLQASDFGVPQRRLRFVMVGVLQGEIDAPFAWPAQTHCAQSDENVLEGFWAATPTVEDAIGDLAFLEPGWEAHRHSAVEASEYARARHDAQRSLFNHLATRHRDKAVRIFKEIAEGRTIGSSATARELTAKVTMARMHRRRISNAVLALPDDMIHYSHDRIPTVREMARLQSFDDDYMFLGKRTSGFVERKFDVPQYTQVGNAVPPLLGRALGTAICSVLGTVPDDIRAIAERRERHRWIRGTSAYAGYTLDPEAAGSLRLTDGSGRPLELPTSNDECPVLDAEALVEWKRVPPSRRGQWAPGIPLPDRRRRKKPPTEVSPQSSPA